MSSHTINLLGCAAIIATLVCIVGSRLSSVNVPFLIGANADGMWQPEVPSTELRRALQHRAEELRANVTADPHNYVGVGETRRITNAFAGFHMSGYFDKPPWSADGSKLLLQRTPNYNQPMSVNESLQVGVVHLDDPHSPRLELLLNTSAWNHQQGTMLQWLGWSDNVMVYNARASDGYPAGAAIARGFVGVMYDIEQRKQLAVLPMPIYSLNTYGTIATSLNFARLYISRRDYGYVVDNATIELERSRKCPDDDGIWLMEGLQDPASVKPRLIVTVRQAFELIAGTPQIDPQLGLKYGTNTSMWDSKAMVDDCVHWLNHAQLNREGNKVLFLYRVGYCSKHIHRPFSTFPITYDIATGELWRVPLAFGSHHDYGWSNNLISCDIGGYYFAQPKTFTLSLQKTREVANGGDGHCSFAPTSNAFLLSDTYPFTNHIFVKPTRALFTWDLVRNRTSVIGYYSPVKEGRSTVTRVDLHPRWSRDGRYVCYDSTHEGLGRQVYVAKVYEKALVRPGVDVLTQSPRKFYVEFGSRRGQAIEAFFADKVDAADYYFQAFEHVPQEVVDLRATLERIAAQRNIRQEQFVLVDAVPWIKDGELTLDTDGGKVSFPAKDVGRYMEETVTYLDHVVCRFDMRGAEYELLTYLIQRGSIILCDAVYMKWHNRSGWNEWNSFFESLVSRMEIPIFSIE